MEIRNLVYFLQLFDDQNYSLAAGKLFITQQALSKSIHNMELELNVELFTKKSNGIVPTTKAIEIEPICRNIVQSYQSGMQKIERISKNDSYPIKVAVSIQTADTLSFTLFRDFIIMYPNIHIEQSAVFDLVAEDLLSKDNVDFAFTVNNPSPKDKYEVEIIKHIQLCIMVNSSHPLATKDKIEISDLENLDLYCAGEGFKTYELLKRKSRDNNVSVNLIPTSGFLYDTYNNIFKNNQAVIGLYGQELGPNFKDIKYIPFSDKEMTWNICLSWKKEHTLSKEEVIFVEYVKLFKE